MGTATTNKEANLPSRTEPRLQSRFEGPVEEFASSKFFYQSSPGEVYESSTVENETNFLGAAVPVALVLPCVWRADNYMDGEGMIGKLFFKLDKVFFGGNAMDLYERYRERALLRTLEHTLEYRFVVYYKKDASNLLSEFCDRYGSDKGAIKENSHPYPWPPHTYTDFYDHLFNHCRFWMKKVFECGVGSNKPQYGWSRAKPGASLRAWKDYFPNAMVYGADIDRDILFEEERIKTFYIDQTDPRSIAEFWNLVGCDNDFDIMIDDGLHTFEAGICLFENSFSKLLKGGIYIIEDVSLWNLNRYQDYFSDKIYKAVFVNLSRPNIYLSDNSLVVIRKT